MDQQKLINELKNRPGALKALMSSGDGQALLRELTRADGGASLQKAVTAAMGGNTADMAQMLGRLMESREGAALIERINHSMQK